MGGPWAAFHVLLVYVAICGQPPSVACVLFMAQRPGSTLHFAAAAENIGLQTAPVFTCTASRPLVSQGSPIISHPALWATHRAAGFLFCGAACTRLRRVRNHSGTSGVCQLQMNEKRYKEQLMGKKFRTAGRSSIARHYRIKAKGGGLPRVRKATGLPSNPIVLPMRRCMLLGKMDNRKAKSISHSGVKTHRIQRVNLAWKRLWWPEGNHYVRVRLSMKGLKTIKKYGLQRAADKFNLNLRDKRIFAGWSHRGKGGRNFDANKTPKTEKSTANSAGGGLPP